MDQWTDNQIDAGGVGLYYDSGDSAKLRDTLNVIPLKQKIGDQEDMPDGNGQQVFFIDDELVERLMRGDAAESSSKPKRPANSSALAKAVKLAASGRLDDAVKELEAAAARGENPVEVYSGLGHLRFEQQKWEEAERCYGKVMEADPNNAAARYNLGLALERQSKFEEAAAAFEAAAQPRSQALAGASRTGHVSDSHGQIRGSPGVLRLAPCRTVPIRIARCSAKRWPCISWDGWTKLPKSTASFFPATPTPPNCWET